MSLRSTTRAGRIFKFVSGTTEEETFHVVTLDGHESLSRPYRFEFNIASHKEEVDFQAILENPAYLGFKQGVSLQGGTKRGVQSLRIHGMITEIEECEQQDNWIIYRAVMVPRLWRLGQNVRSRIFMDKSVIEIIEKVLKDNGFEGEDYEFRTDTREYGKREYVVQYEESDLDFISRLMEHEGIFYFFSHANDCDRVIISDAPGAYDPLPGDNGFRFTPVSESSAALDILGIDAISRITKFRQTVQKEVRLRDYNYRKPGLDLGVSQEVTGEGYGIHAFYGEHYKTPEDGKALAQIRAQEILWQQNLFRGTSDIRSLRCGFVFHLEGHPREGYAGAYVATEIRHKGEQMIPTSHGAALNAVYENEYTSIPADIIFRPKRETPKPRIWGTMTARIDAGSDGQYAEIDKMGRYKVQILFAPGASGGRASRFVRMAQPYAGGGMGMHFPLHKGTEVLLTHIGGDPDRPIIVGAVPNPETASPVTGGNHTKNKIATGGANGIEIDDLEGAQQIHLASPCPGKGTFITFGH